MENIALLKTISKSTSGETVAHIKEKYLYKLSFDVVGSVYAEIRLKHPVTNKMLKMVNLHCNFTTGTYEFPFVSLNDAELIFIVRGSGIIDNLKVQKG